MNIKIVYRQQNHQKYLREDSQLINNFSYYQLLNKKSQQNNQIKINLKNNDCMEIFYLYKNPNFFEFIDKYFFTNIKSL